MVDTTAKAGYRLTAREEEGALVLDLQGRIALGDADGLFARMDGAAAAGKGKAVRVDLAGVSFMDSAGVLTLIRLEESVGKKGLPFALLNVPDAVAGVMALIDRVQTKRVEAAMFRDLDPDLDSFVSCNTPEAYAAALVRLKADATPS